MDRVGTKSSGAGFLFTDNLLRIRKNPGGDIASSWEFRAGEWKQAASLPDIGKPEHHYDVMFWSIEKYASNCPQVFGSGFSFSDMNVLSLCFLYMCSSNQFATISFNSF